MAIQLCAAFLRELAEQRMTLGHHYESQGAPEYVTGRCFAEGRNIYRIAAWIEAPDGGVPELELVPRQPVRD